jgi:prolyl 4-hydroxylase
MAQSVSLTELLVLAQSGNPGAQYALSANLHQQGKAEESLHWLRAAAAQSLVPAQLTLATMLVDGRHCPRDRQAAIELLGPLAATQVQANLLLAEIHGFTALGGTNREEALRHLMSAARRGDAGALRQLALLASCHRLPGLVPSLLGAAVRAGDALAQALATRHAPAAGTATAVDWQQVLQALPQLAAAIPLPEPELLHAAPLVRRYRRVFEPLVLDAVIGIAAPLVQRSQIVDASTGQSRPDPMRSSSHITLGPRQHDHVLEALEHCISRVSGLPVLHAEFLQVLRYRRGEEFRLHVDYFNESGAGSYQSLADGGQRAQTVLAYLNEGYAGGSTRFPELQLDIQGEPGDLLHFHNLRSDGIGDRASLHAGMPVLDGEKWLLSQWIRADRYPTRLAW